MRLIISILILSVGFSQRLSEVIETYDYGNIKSITYHKKTENDIEIVKYEKYYENGHKEEERAYKNGEKIKETYWDENGQKWYEITYKDGNIVSYKRWNEDGSVNND